MITKWLKDSGLVVNESKTEICMFHKHDQQKIKINVCGTEIMSKHFINVLGVTFDSKLNWSMHVTNVISKAKKSLYALRQLKQYFSTSQMRTLLDTYFYSVLYYNSTVWLSPDLNSSCKQSLLSVSALALRSCMSPTNYDVSFINIHKMFKKCTPDQIMLYQISLLLFRTVNETCHFPSSSFVKLMDQIVCTSRQVMFETHRANKSKIGMNSLENKLYHVSKLILMDKLNWSLPLYKKHMKLQFLKFGNT